PYSDNIMRKVFHVVVGSFQGLNQIESSSFAKRVTILENVAKVRSCALMLDLECDGFILRMFEQFLDTMHEGYGEKVISSIQEIMSLVINESDVISEPLLSILLTRLRTDKEKFLVAHGLFKRVVENCEEKLRPHLVEAHME
ncbi:hypothetical protein KI387_010008, partial [Taxus chinensis]